MAWAVRSRLGRGLWRGGAVLLVLLLGGAGYALTYGPASPYSPLLPGFTTHQLPHLIVCAERGARWDDVRACDDVTEAVQKDHRLRFTGRPRVMVFRDRASYLRHTPTRARFCAFYNGTLVVSPWAQQEAAAGKISLRTYLRHELSHVLLFQRMSLPAALRSPKWLVEGLATYTADQRGTTFYPGRAETYRLIAAGNFLPPGLFKTRAESSVALRAPNRFPFLYSQYACLVEYLIQTRGGQRFWTYVAALTAGEQSEAAFRRVYGVSLEAVTTEFREYATRNGSHGGLPRGA